MVPLRRYPCLLILEQILLVRRLLLFQQPMLVLVRVVQDQQRQRLLWFLQRLMIDLFFMLVALLPHQLVLPVLKIRHNLLLALGLAWGL